jgi:WD40 repeat protein
MVTLRVVRISDGIVVNMIRGASPVDASWDGVIAYRTFGAMYKTQLTWFDRTGTRLATAGPVTTDVSVTLSQDDKRAFVSSLSETGRSTGRGELPVNIWMVDLARSLRTRITFEPSNSDENPTLSPDGRSFVFASHLKGANAELYQKMSSGGGETVPILLGPGNEHPIDWSPDGKYLVTSGSARGTESPIRIWACIRRPSGPGILQISSAPNAFW